MPTTTLVTSAKSTTTVKPTTTVKSTTAVSPTPTVAAGTFAKAVGRVFNIDGKVGYFVGTFPNIGLQSLSIPTAHRDKLILDWVSHQQRGYRSRHEPFANSTYFL